MAWPPSDIPTGNLDAGTDSPQTARADLLGLAQAFNLLRNHFSAFMRGLAETVDAPAARTALGASTVGSNVFTAVDQATARGAIGAAAAGDTVNLFGAQTMAGLKTFAGGHLSNSNTQAIGYTTGAGGQVTQSGDKLSGVILDRPCGRIITANTSMINGQVVAFNVINNKVFNTSCVFLSTDRSGYRIEAVAIADGAFVCRITNQSGATLADAININMVVLNSATA